MNVKASPDHSTSLSPLIARTDGKDATGTARSTRSRRFPRDLVEFNPTARPCPVAVVVMDRGLEAREVNDVWSELTGRSAARSLGLDWLTAVKPPDTASLVSHLRDGPLRADRGVTECRLTGPARTLWTRWWWRVSGDTLVVCIADIDEEREREAELVTLATHDSLTALVNRAHFLELTERALARTQRSRRGVGIVFVDLDNFKEVNDRSGHAEGDRVLTEAAERLKAAIRPADVVGRMGGDEFAVLCEDVSEIDEVLVVAQRVVAALDTPTRFGMGPNLKASAGVALSMDRDTGAEALVALADAAMYRVKRGTAPAAGVHRVDLDHPEVRTMKPDGETIGGIVDGIGTSQKAFSLRVIDRLHEAGMELAMSKHASRLGCEGFEKVVDILDGLIADARENYRRYES